MSDISDVTTRARLRTVNTVALAYFTNREHLSDAAHDLCSAGFQADQLHISQPLNDSLLKLKVGGDEPLQVLGAHSLRWLLNRTKTHDRQRRGADQMHGLDPEPLEGTSPTCSTLDLSSALTAMDVRASMIQLLQRDTRMKGMHMLVDASDRVSEADTIMSDNAGLLRTRYLQK